MKNLKFRTKVALLSGIISCVCVLVFSISLVIGLYVELLEGRIYYAESLSNDFLNILDKDPNYFSSDSGKSRIKNLQTEKDVMLLKATNRINDGVLIQSDNWQSNQQYTQNGVYYYSNFIFPDKAPLLIKTIKKDNIELQFHIILYELKAEVFELLFSIIFALPLAAITAATGGWFLSKKILATITNITDIAESITANSLNKKIPVDNPNDEIGKLVQVLNIMIHRLDISFQQAVRFSADASHELKTPLAILKLNLEEAQLRKRNHDIDQKTFLELSEEINRLSKIIENLLLLSKVDAGKLVINKNKVSLNEILSALIEDIESTKFEKELNIKSNIPPNIVTVGDKSLLTQVFENLISNAIKYNRIGGDLSVDVKLVDAHIETRIQNSGKRIPTESQPHIFERFYRSDAAHSRKVDGTGLGLSLCQEIIRAHSGNITLEVSDKTITRFLVVLKPA